VTRSLRRTRSKNSKNFKIVKINQNQYNHPNLVNQVHYLRSAVAEKETCEKRLDWNTIPSLPLTKILSHLKPKERQNIFLTSKYWSSICRNSSKLWQEYTYEVKDSRPIHEKSWKRANIYLSTYAGHIKKLNVKFDLGRQKQWQYSHYNTNWNVQKIQNFLGIFNLIMTKPLRKKARIRELNIENLNFDQCQWPWGTGVAPSWLSKREYARNFDPQWYMEVFIGLLCNFLTYFDRCCLDRISFKNMTLTTEYGLQVIESLVWAGYGRQCKPLELNLYRFFEMWPYTDEMDEEDRFADALADIKLRKLEIDGDMIDSVLLSALGDGSGEALEQLTVIVDDIYRHTEYPWSDTGRTAECTEWKEFETKCPNAQINMKFCQQVCEHPNAKDIIGHFLRKAKRITSIELARQDVKRFNHYDYYNMRGSPRGSQILIRKFID
jgi:hypothetical protein